MRYTPSRRLAAPANTSTTKRGSTTTWRATTRPSSVATSPKIRSNLPAGQIRTSIYVSITPAHDGRRPRLRHCRRWSLVSIHARARRATVSTLDAVSVGAFQFTPAHDGRPHSFALWRRRSCFNSRPRTTGDRWPAGRPPQRACFNSRPRTTGDHPNAEARAFNRFQFTPAHDGRLTPFVLVMPMTVSFTPAHTGDRHFWIKTFRVNVSIHARARRATAHAAADHHPVTFQFRPAHDGRPVTISVATNRPGFIHARARRATRYWHPPGVGSWFQFTPAHDGRREREKESVQLIVSIHARARRATPCAR